MTSINQSKEKQPRQKEETSSRENWIESSHFHCLFGLHSSIYEAISISPESGVDASKDDETDSLALIHHPYKVPKIASIHQTNEPKKKKRWQIYTNDRLKSENSRFHHPFGIQSSILWVTAWDGEAEILALIRIWFAFGSWHLHYWNLQRIRIQISLSSLKESPRVWVWVQGV